jgi:ribosomal protein S4
MSDKFGSNPWDPRDMIAKGIYNSDKNTIEIKGLQYYGTHLINMDEVLYIKVTDVSSKLIERLELSHEIHQEIKFKNGEMVDFIERRLDNGKSTEEKS